jgi:hypothetical protein
LFPKLLLLLLLLLLWVVELWYVRILEIQHLILQVWVCGLLEVLQGPANKQRSTTAKIAWDK